MMGIQQDKIYDVSGCIPHTIIRQLMASACTDKMRPNIMGFWWWKGCLFSTDTHRLSMFYDLPTIALHMLNDLPEGRYETIMAPSNFRSLVQLGEGDPPKHIPTIINRTGSWFTIGEWSNVTGKEAKRWIRADGMVLNPDYMPVLKGNGKVMACQTGPSNRNAGPMVLSCEVDWITRETGNSKLKCRFAYVWMPMHDEGICAPMPWPETPIGIGPGPTFFAGHEWGCKELPAWSA